MEQTTFIVDLEANGLLDTVTQIHCIVARNNERVYKFHEAPNLERDGGIDEGIRFLGRCNTLVFHNGTAYDIPVLRRLYHWADFSKSTIHDTYVLSQLFFCEETKVHGIEAWGKKFGRLKPPITDYSKFTPDLLHRCIEDTAITQMLWQKCESEMSKWDWSHAMKIEYAVYNVFCRNQIYWYLDKDKANTYISNLTRLVNTCTGKLVRLAPKQVIRNEAAIKPFTQQGQPSARFIKWLTETSGDMGIVGGEFCKLSFVDMNFNSSSQVKHWLLSIGWVPEKWNHKKDERGKPARDEKGKLIKTSPSLTDTDFIGIEGNIGRYLKIRSKASHRLNTIKGWVNSLFDGNKIPTFAYTNGTNCVTADTLITTDTGLIPIIDVCKGDKVLTHDGTYHSVTDFIVNGVRDIYNVHLESGQVIKCTDKHPFLSPNGKWIRADELETEQEVLYYMNSEEWSEHPNFPDYSFSTWGRIIRRDTGRFIMFTNSTSLTRRQKLYERGDTELVNKYGVQEHHSRGRLILEVFNGFSHLECRHLDGNPTNNFIGNLSWGTSRENTADQFLHGRLELVHRSRGVLTDDQIAYIKNTPYYRGFDTHTSNLFKCSRKLIQQIRNGKCYKKYSHEIRNKYIEQFRVTKVKHVAKHGKEHVYDITVDGAHSFVGNGVIMENTGRWRHVGVVNVPKAEDDKFFGKQMRSLFIAPKGYTLVGCDSAQLEARIEGHFAAKYDGGEYLNWLLSADIHSFNAKSWGVTRSQAKSPYYALSYGCAPDRIKKLLQCSDEVANLIYKKYWEDRPALKMLVDDLESAVIQRHQGKRTKRRAVKLDLTTQPWVKGIDDRKLYVRSAHSLKNTLIQNAGMLTMKAAYCYLDKWIRNEELDARIVMVYHDEFIVMVKDEERQINKVKALAEQSIVKGGEYFKLRAPLAGEAKIGNSWGMIH